MRGFFLLLLLTNIAFIAWQYSQSVKQPEVDNIYRGISLVNEGLTRLEELPPEALPGLREPVGDGTVAEEPVNDEPKPPALERSRDVTEQEEAGLGSKEQQRLTTKGPTCQYIDDIDGRKILDRVLAVLRSNGATTIEQGEKQVKRTNFWVMLPPYKSRSQADAAAATLAAKRIKDYFIVRSGDYENGVSLGVFSTRERAQRRYKEIVDLKAKLRRPKIEAIELPAKRYFVSYMADEDSMKKLERSWQEMKLTVVDKISCK